MSSMKIFIVLLALGLLNAQATNLELLKTINYVRANPKTAAQWFKDTFLNKDIKGIATDANCYEEAFNFLNNAPAVPTLAEDAGLDLACSKHSIDQIASNTFSHTGSDKSDAASRIRSFGSFSGAYAFTEIMSKVNRSQLVSAKDIVMIQLSECGSKSKDNRAHLMSSAFTSFGAASSNKERRTINTIILARGFTRAPITNAQLDAANIEGNGLYSGAGHVFSEVKLRRLGEFVHSGAQIHTAKAIENIDDTNGELGNLVDDKSVKCPTFINPSNEKRTVRVWTKTSRTCRRNTEPFGANNLDRVAPFAQKGKCYFRLQWCSKDGAIHVLDREYKTEDEVKNGAAPVTVSNELGDALCDSSIKCTKWINDNLAVRTVLNWTLTTSKCTRGQNGFDAATGVLRAQPFAKRGYCYHRLSFCDEKGAVWVFDREFLTYAQWQATQPVRSN